MLIISPKPWTFFPLLLGLYDINVSLPRGAFSCSRQSGYAEPVSQDLRVKWLCVIWKVAFPELPSISRLILLGLHCTWIAPTPQKLVLSPQHVPAVRGITQQEEQLLPIKKQDLTEVDTSGKYSQTSRCLLGSTGDFVSPVPCSSSYETHPVSLHPNFSLHCLHYIVYISISMS